jgi:hypothetical protein
MLNPSNELLERAMRYATARSIVLKHALGYGKDGLVYATSSGSAVKVFGAQATYLSERNCYLRLAEHEVMEVVGHRVPQLLAWNNELLIVEMTIVHPPYLLDFAGAHLDRPVEFSAEVLEQWEADRLEEFGPRWGRVRMIMEVMAEQYGIYLTDVHPRNIAFA